MNDTRTLCVGPHDEDNPRTAAPGIKVCRSCEDRTRDALQELPELWADLASPSRGKALTDGSRSTTRPEPISGDARDLRTAIRITLIRWCKTLAKEHDIDLPDEDQITGFTRALVLQYQDAKRQALTDGDRARAENYSNDISDIRAARATGSDIIGGLCTHLSRHTSWLLNSPHADLYVHQITARTYEARRTAHPSRPDIVVNCPCGSRVALNMGQTGITCKGCGDQGDVGWWMERVGRAPTRPMKINELAPWIRAFHKIDVSTRQLRNWRARFIGFPLPIEGDGRGHTYRYDPTAVAAFVIKRSEDGDAQIHRLTA